LICKSSRYQGRKYSAFIAPPLPAKIPKLVKAAGCTGMQRKPLIGIGKGLAYLPGKRQTRLLPVAVGTFLQPAAVNQIPEYVRTG
jgi:hypothetical protein